MWAGRLAPDGGLSVGSPAGPAAAVPVATEVGCVHRHDDDVTQAGWNVAVASRADVGLRGLVGLDEPLLQVAENLGVLHVRCPGRVRRPPACARALSWECPRAGSQEQGPGQEQHGHGYGSAHVDEVTGPTCSGALRIESHGVSIVPPGHASPPPSRHRNPDVRSRLCGIASAGTRRRFRYGRPGPDGGPRGLGQILFLLPRARRFGRARTVPAIGGGEIRGPRRPGRGGRRGTRGHARLRRPLLGCRDTGSRSIHPRGSRGGGPTRRFIAIFGPECPAGCLHPPPACCRNSL